MVCFRLFPVFIVIRGVCSCWYRSTSPTKSISATKQRIQLRSTKRTIRTITTTSKCYGIPIKSDWLWTSMDLEFHQIHLELLDFVWNLQIHLEFLRIHFGSPFRPLGNEAFSARRRTTKNQLSEWFKLTPKKKNHSKPKTTQKSTKEFCSTSACTIWMGSHFHFYPIKL